MFKKITSVINKLLGCDTYELQQGWRKDNA